MRSGWLSSEVVRNHTKGLKRSEILEYDADLDYWRVRYSRRLRTAFRRELRFREMIYVEAALNQFLVWHKSNREQA